MASIDPTSSTPDPTGALPTAADLGPLPAPFDQLAGLPAPTSAVPVVDPTPTPAPVDPLKDPAVQAAIQTAIDAGIAAQVKANAPEAPALKVGQLVDYVHVDDYHLEGPTEVRKLGLVMELSEPDAEGHVTALLAWIDQSGSIDTRSLEPR